MSIAPYGIGISSALRSADTFRSLKSELGALQTQLSTGKKATSYSGLGGTAATSLSARARLASLDATGSGIASGQLRVKLAGQGVGQIASMGSSLLTSLPRSLSSKPIGQTTVMISADDGLKQAIDLLNTEVDGRYLFSGRSQDVQPVASYDLILNGDATHAGLKQLVSERKAADLGTSGLGRLTVANSGTTSTISEESAGLPFGFKIQSASATGMGLTATSSAGPPASAQLGVAAQPAAGDTISVVFGLPNGTTTTFTLTAKAEAGVKNGFQIGANAATTAANFQAALGTALATAASTTLAGASAAKAAQDFFAGSTSSPPVRVGGPPFDTATGTVAGTAANTVVWYRGDDAAGSARATAPVKTDAGSIGIGLRANEAGIQAVLSGLGALVGQTFASTDPSSDDRYAATVDAMSTLLGGDGMEQITADMSVASAALDAAQTRVSTATNQVQDTLAGAEDADPNEVAMKLLAAQTKLQASYQTTSTIAKLSLVNFL